VDDFAGVEPLVGEIVGLRTFRVDETGLLLPLFSEGCWYDGSNTALCGANRNPRRPTHAVPDVRCGCGFYVYGSVQAARQNRGTRYVQAVVSVWGNVLAGTKGVRAEHARIEALWLHPSAPAWLRQRVAVRYPSARLYADPEAMFTEHPLTQLSCYEAVVRPGGHRAPRPRSAWSPPWRWAPCPPGRCMRSARCGTSGSRRPQGSRARWRGSPWAPASPATARRRCWWWACWRG
jgi:hypothetical protein